MYKKNISHKKIYRHFDIEQFFKETGFRVIDRGSVMKIPVLIWRKCPRHLVRLLAQLDNLWPWPMHEYVFAETN